MTVKDLNILEALEMLGMVEGFQAKSQLMMNTGKFASTFAVMVSEYMLEGDKVILMILYALHQLTGIDVLKWAILWHIVNSLERMTVWIQLKVDEAGHSVDWRNDA